MSETAKPEIKVFPIHQDEFSILGNENILTESSDFGYTWDNFFKKGGYDPILPYAVSPKPINVWYTNNAGENIYFQGLFVKNVEKVPDGYQLVDFPASDFLVVTTEWMATNEEAVGENGNGRCNRYADTVQIPEGYIRNDGPGSPITAIEKENADTPEGSRYEVWVPIKKISDESSEQA
jgi:predicted transcriptional regulator YdeE